MSKIPDGPFRIIVTPLGYGIKEGKDVLGTVYYTGDGKAEAFSLAIKGLSVLLEAANKAHGFLCDYCGHFCPRREEKTGKECTGPCEAEEVISKLSDAIDACRAGEVDGE